MSEGSIDAGFGAGSQPCWFDVGVPSATLMAALRKAQLRQLFEQTIQYHDTPNRELTRLGLVLSVVSRESQHQQQLEALDSLNDDEPLAHTDRNAEQPDLGWVLDQKPDLPLQNLTDEPLEAVVTLQLERREYERSPARGLTVQITLLAGLVTEAAEPVPVLRLAIQRRIGPVYRYLRWLRALASALELSLSTERLARRGLRLAGLPVPDVVMTRVDPGVTKSQAPASTAASVLLLNSGKLTLCALPAVLLSEHPEPVHQFRVGLRRFRSLIRFFEPVIGDQERSPRWSALREQASHFARSAGEIRNCDVFGAEVLNPLLRVFVRDVSLLGLQDGLQRLRTQRHRAACAEIDSARFTRFLLAMFYECERLTRSAAEPSLGEFAPPRLLEFSRRLRRRVRSATDPQSWHRARIAGKDLRYALEATAMTLQPRKKARKALADLVLIQELLGQLEDRSSAQLIAEAAADAYLMEGLMRVRASSLVAAWCAAESRQLSNRDKPADRLTERCHTRVRALVSR